MIIHFIHQNTVPEYRNVATLNAFKSKVQIFPGPDLYDRAEFLNMMATSPHINETQAYAFYESEKLSHLETWLIEIV
ncbi:hypothetical protein EJF18_70149 [Clavispora lusitaniae]|uniref:Uncharacterized protein n=1 Tax=Clavispora lusitaniae TaxID=36911 RepID=A0ACD0WSS3_CLALS|nr:hypothetical protein EJF14_70149 [Clavispora lusitaniae]QFZ35746.1 hypothetical protein EJF16_70149 [Clavispora lusitaniae]QFZ41428.1 hypothetical protein EJF15_70149 [Clavispora lusitaniae]QFZ47106.1 hypothetical protein EJF18_70149 [Clavispora lusitaniae]QFZ52783.1 hypothetical protein EJF17_70149 [Clavispora lusitaniae]